VDWHGEKHATPQSQSKVDEGAQEGASSSPLRPAAVGGLAIGGPSGVAVELSAADIVAAAGKVSDKIGQIGSATTARSDEAGLLWTGLKAAPVDTVKGYWVSDDGKKRYRPPSYKPTFKVWMSNFESGPPPKRPHKDKE
jgi:hypothetical protein